VELVGARGRVDRDVAQRARELEPRH
jgi:hypothetical protein